jgi:hypothetical protein
VGVEAANFVFIPNTARGSELVAIVESLGATRFGSKEGRYVVRGDDHWIDLKIGTYGRRRVPSVSVRVALSNPPPAYGVLTRLLASLLRLGGGQVIDPQSREEFSELDQAAQDRVRSALEARRADFERQFGPLEAAISGDDVFDYLHGRSDR